MQGLSKLAREGFLEKNSIYYIDITKLLAKITTSNDWLSKELSLSLYSIGILSKSNVLTRFYTENFFSNILDKLLSLDPSARDISLSLYGLGFLAESGFLVGRVGSSHVSKELLKRFRPMEAQEVSNSLQGAIYCGYRPTRKEICT